MNHVLICSAAGYTNIGDDAILWGMLSQLRQTLGTRELQVCGGPALGSLVTSSNVTVISYTDEPALARAIEDAALVIIGGGGVFYEVGFEADLGRFFSQLSEAPWPYRLARIAAAARAAARPLLLYGVGVGPLLTEPARRLVRFVADQAVVSVRDTASRDLLRDCGIAPTRVHLTADPAVEVDPGPAGEAEALLQASGLTGLPRPWIALNFRPWYGYGKAGEDNTLSDRLIASCGLIVAEICEKLGGSAVLMPFQRELDRDPEMLTQVLEAAGRPKYASLVAPSLLPPQLVSMLQHFDIMVAMRMHALLLAMNAGLPFVGLSYDQKVSEFARAAGMEDSLYTIERLDPVAITATCSSLLERRSDIAVRLARKREEMRELASIPAAMAAEMIDGKQPTRFMVAIKARRDLRVLMQIRPDYREVPGGDVVQIMCTKSHLEKLGVRIDLSTDETAEVSSYDLVHTFCLGVPDHSYNYTLNAATQGAPIALSTIYADTAEMWQWGVPEHWELPDPNQGLPVPRQAPPLTPQVRRAEALEHIRRQVLIDWATVYLPNGLGEAEQLRAAHNLDLSRTVIVPNAAGELFFHATPDAFMAKYGRRDFVLCAARMDIRKNLLSLVAAMRGTGLPLVLIGKAYPESYRALCQRYADEHTLFIDHLPQEELASAYAAAKVHVLPSWFETPGISSLEAAAAGCNIVSSDRGLAREYLGEMAWYCDPRSASSIREAVLAAYAAPRSDRLREHVRSNYTWDKTAEKTLEGYHLACALQQKLSPAERQERITAATKRHAEWLTRLVADLRDELAEMTVMRQVDCERLASELERITSRRLYRLSVVLGRSGWQFLRSLGMRR